MFERKKEEQKTTDNERFHASGGVFPPTVLWEFGSLSPARTFVEPPPAPSHWALYAILRTATP